MFLDKIAFWTSRMWKTFLLKRHLTCLFFSHLMAIAKPTSYDNSGVHPQCYVIFVAAS